MNNVTRLVWAFVYIAKTMPLGQTSRWSLSALAVLVAFLSPAEGAAQESPHGSFERQCTECHTLEGWKPLRDPLEFQHGSTGFPLAGSHRAVPCTSCHETLDFPLVATACADCHADPHVGELGFGCEDCHVPAGWDNRREMFEIHGATLFPLVGVHATVDCAGCHREVAPFEYALTPVECFACHAADYSNTTRPDHARVGFPTECEICHSPIGWNFALFDGGVGFAHDSFFPLTGSHRGLDCSACHADGFFGTSSDCYACHRGDYDQTSDPNHAAAGFPTDCESCHSTQGWGGAVLDHDSVFRLTGAHRGLDCELCHATGFAGTPTDCYSCHRGDYDQTSDPNHVAAGFPTDCEACHSTQGWGGAAFDHDNVFRLTGAHRGLDCESCHAAGFAGTPTDCYSCHRSEYQATRDPNHQAAGFPTACETCHDTTSWRGADFDHDQFFRLTGAHRTLDCDACHSKGFAGTPTDCYSCHRGDYDQTSDPNHVAAGFPTDCELCHNTSNWEDADFIEHDSLYFPIFSGRHRGEWDSCSDCHMSASNFSAFECINCHEHQCSDMNDKHKDVAGYSCVSTACYSCHPTGNED